MTNKHSDPDLLELVQSERRAPPRPSRLIAAAQRHLLDTCERRLAQLFSQLDDRLYDLSQRAASNIDEDLYFEAMRKLRMARQDVSRRFLQNLGMNFNLLTPGRSNPSVAENFDAQSLSLMEGDELEIDLALKGMVNRIREAHRQSLYELVRRLDHLLAGTAVNESNNPLDPQQVAQAFIDACDSELNIPINVRLILLELFEEQLLRQLGGIIATTNQSFIDAGILPKIPRRIASPDRTARTPREPVSPESTVTKPHPSEQPRFNLSLDNLMSLMTAARTSGQAEPKKTLDCFVFASGNSGALMETDQLTSMLTHSQQLVERQLSRKPRNLLPELIQSLLRKTDNHAPRALAECDEAVINLVSLFFDEVLADDNLPLAVDALICRLQLPFLKVALKDPTLFQNIDHPARQLVNSISAAGIGFDEDKQLERDPVYRKIDDVVHTLTRGPQVDVDLFRRLNEELNDLVQAEQRKVSVVEKRTNQAATGRARIRAAKLDSQNLLYRKLRNVRLPWEVNEFLTTAWLQVLIITQLKHGCDSGEWVNRGDIVSKLIEACQSQPDRMSRPALMQRVEAGLEAAIESPEVRMLKIEELQAALARIDAASEQIDYQPLTAEQQAALGQFANQQENGSSGAEACHSLESKAVAAAAALQEGQWVEYFDGEKKTQQRYKLAARVNTDTCVFVNRKGFKALECGYRELALAIQEGRAKLLDTRAFFDRVMSRAVSQIRQAA